MSRSSRPALAALAALVLGAAPSAAGEPPSAASCAPIAGLADELLAPGVVLLLGEIHGTAEAPAFAADVACAAARAGRRVLMALELPGEEAAAIETFLAGAGEPADRAALLAGPFWRREYQDGRSSRAIVDLLEELRRLRASGHAVRVTAYDRAEPPRVAQERERAMAEELARALGADGDAVTVVLAGNVHSRLRIGVPWAPSWSR